MSIARRITLYILLFSGLFTLLGTGFQLFVDYEQDLEGVDATFRLIKKSHIESLSINIWHLDEANVETQLTEIMNLPDIAHLQLKVPIMGEITKGNLPESQSKIVQQFDLAFKSNNKSTITPVGQLTVSITLKNIYQKLQDKLVVILFTQAIKVFFVSLFILLLVYMLVTRHLERISEFVANTTMHSLSDTLQLRPSPALLRWKESEDELSILVNSINSMRAELSSGLDAKHTVEQQLREEIKVREQTEVALRESKEQQSDLLNNTSSVIYMKDLDGHYIFVNRMFEKLFHITNQEILHKTDYDLFPKEMADHYKHNDLAASESGKPIELEEIVPLDDGEHTYISVKFPLKKSTGETYAICGISTDITERKQAAKEVHRLRNYLANIIDSMPSILIGVDSTGIVTQWNHEAQLTTGIPADRAVGRTLGDAFPRLSKEMGKIATSIKNRHQESDPKRAYQQNGETHFEDITIYPLTANGVEGAVIRVDDVTEQVRLEEMMIQTEKMLSVGGLAAGMAHEINNPLAGMMQTANVLGNRLTNIDIPANIEAAKTAGIDMQSIQHFMQERGVLRMVDSITESGRRVADIVDNMLSFSRKSNAIVSSHEVSELLDKTLELAATDYDLKKQYDFKAIKIIKEYTEKLPPVPCEGAKIQQVILNILRNGAQAMEDPAIDTPTFILRTYHEPEKSSVCIEIKDNGKGMDAATRKRIFEPFFTTKPVGVGTGLGLSVSYFIITENHEGEMSVDSEPDKGATFVIRLPLNPIGKSE